MEIVEKMIFTEENKYSPLHRMNKGFGLIYFPAIHYLSIFVW